MNILVVGASKGLGRAFVEGLGREGDSIVGVSRTRPDDLAMPASVSLQWIEADMAAPQQAADRIERQTPQALDAIIYNLGIWEAEAFSEDYAFLETSDQSVTDLVNVNITGAILLLKRLIPRLLRSRKPQLLLTGSTSGLRQSGRPEVAFGASKFALTGIADTLREGFREQRLAVTCLQLGYLNTDDGLCVPLGDAAGRGEGHLVPVHDVVNLVRAVLDLSSASFVRELVLPAILDERF